MDQDHKEVMGEIQKECEHVHTTPVLIYPHLNMSGIFTWDEIQMIEHRITDTEKMTEIFRILKGKEVVVFFTLQRIAHDQKQHSLYKAIQKTLEDQKRDYLIWDPKNRSKELKIPTSNQSTNQSFDVVPTSNQPTTRSSSAAPTSSPPKYESNTQAPASTRSKHGHETMQSAERQKAKYNPNDDMYPNSTRPYKGHVIIVNNKNFPRRKEGVRHGTDEDERVMNKFFTNQDYKVEVKKDLKAQEMKNEMIKFGKKAEHANCHSAVAIILTHGGDGKLSGVDEETVEVDEILECLNSANSQGLQNKPKIFIIQACRGGQRDKGVYVLAEKLKSDNKEEEEFYDATDSFDDDDIDTDSVYDKDPTDAHFFVASSTTAGNGSYRDTTNGSWFIQSIYKVFNEQADYLNITDLFTRVNNTVAKMGTRKTVQMSEFRSTLRHQFYLNFNHN